MVHSFVSNRKRARPLAIEVQSSLAREQASMQTSATSSGAGAWRTERPVYVDRLPPCNQACPTGENIQSWLYHAQSGDYRRAWNALVLDNPLPAVTGRVCYRPCEQACNRGRMDQAVGIHAVERFLADEAIRLGWQFEGVPAPTGKRVLIIGAGPSGLSAAYQLKRLGHDVSIREAGPKAGGMLRFGIPQYRLPRPVLDAEVARIEALGIEIRLNSKVDDLAAAMRDGAFDAAFLAVGAHLAKRTAIPAADASRILDALSVLRGMESDETPLLGRRVLVYGGGNTALDIARTAKRLGATDSIIVYRRTREKMPAHDFEVQEALEEGIRIQWLSTIKEAGENSFVVEKMKLDETGFPRPTGEFEQIQADSLVLALGQDVDLGFLRNVAGLDIADGVVKVDAHMMTGCAGVFAGGDMVPCERTVTVAIGHGKKAARNIDAWLQGKAYAAPPKHELAAFESLNTWYYTEAPASIQPQLDLERRQSTFEEVIGGLDVSSALYEARRCLSCGNCFECDKCYNACPDNAVVKLDPGQRFRFDYEYCQGCGVCAQECPCGAIAMTPEPA
jgi:NADPH-dependent glutamate synthase beta subunit-like oxidoreductase